MKIQKQIPVTSYRAASFIAKYQKIVTYNVIPYQYKVLWDQIEGAEKSHVAQNFINAAKALKGENVEDGFYGMVFQDSDAYKWLEAVAFSLANKADPELEKKADSFIDMIADAQDEDGYLNTYFTIKDKDKRWTNLLEAHELYCSGHMIEAACAYFEATGKRKFLDVAIKNAECIYDKFIVQGKQGIPGHPEIELALMKLYRLTDNKHFLELAKMFVDLRGVDPTIYAKEAENRDWSVWQMDPMDNEYRQSHMPVRKQSEAVGHAVRAVYLYTGMADLGTETDDKELLDACQRLWDNIVNKRMYVTGGIGSTVTGEAFTVDYDLPQDTAYSETCAAIGLMFFASRMLENNPCSKYADIMELAFYNTVLAGMQLDGQKFFYVNPLEINPGISGVACTHKHVLPSRPSWYACACCPPNAARLIESIGKYAYGENDTTAFCHMYAAGSVDFANGISIECSTDYPYDMTVNYKVSGNGKLAIRIPSWSQQYIIKMNGEPITEQLENGYIYFDIKDSAAISLELDDKPFFLRASNKVPRLTGMTALMRGPLVYCFEGTDNQTVTDLYIDKSVLPKVNAFDANELGGTIKLTAKAKRLADCQELYSRADDSMTDCEAIAIPYYTWGNRSENEMRVWMESIHN